MAAPRQTPRPGRPSAAAPASLQVEKGTLDSRFTLAHSERRFRMMYLDIGEEGTGKSDFGLTMPKPLLVQSLDIGGLEGLLEQPRFAGQEIYLEEYAWQPGAGHLDMKEMDDKVVKKQLSELATELTRKLVKDFIYALENGIRSVLWDKETDVWEMARFSEFGGPNDAPRNYPQLNAFYKSLILKPYGFNVNFGLIEGFKDEWAAKADPRTGEQKPKSTGRRVRQGFDRAPELVQIVIEHEGNPRVVEEGVVENSVMRIGKSRQNTSLAGTELPNMSFPDLAQMVFPDSTLEDWS